MGGSCSCSCHCISSGLVGFILGDLFVDAFQILNGIDQPLFELHQPVRQDMLTMTILGHSISDGIHFDLGH